MLIESTSSINDRLLLKLQTEVGAQLQIFSKERPSKFIARLENPNVLVEFSNRTFIKGFASGTGYNCLIQTLLACLNDNDLLCVADVPRIRQELRQRFRQGENRVTERNYLDLRNHWTSIIDLIGISARANGCDPTNQIKARNFNVTAVLEEQRIVVERDGVGPINLFVLNGGIRHFVPLLRNRQRWLQG